MRDPACSKQPPPLDAGDGGRVAGHEGEAEVRAKRLRHRTEMRPASPPRLTERVAAAFCDVEGMIILEHKHRRVAREHGFELRGTLGVDRRSIRVLSARR